MSPDQKKSGDDFDGLERARELIRQAKANRSPHLDLGRFGLEEIPEEITELPWLESLVLGSWWLDPDSQELHYSTNDGLLNSFSTVCWLDRLTRLKYLSLSECYSLTSVEGLRGLASLQTLSLDDCLSLPDLDALRELTSLQHLYLGWYESLTDLDVLRKLTGLQTLSLRGCESLTDLDVLRELTGLRYLDLGWYELLTDLHVLRKLTGLQHLDLHGCKSLASVDTLRKLTGLQHLDLSLCESLTDLDALRELTGLQHLNLSGCKPLTDLDVLRELTGLQHLDLRGCVSLTDLDVLRELTGLQHLSLGGCESLTDLDALRELTGLQYLDLGWCKSLTDLDVLRKLTGLQYLGLSRCASLTDLDVLRKLTGLQHLDLGWCESLTDLDVLRELTGLQYLDLGECVSLTSFPRFVLDLNTLKYLILHGTPLRDLPTELLGTNPYDNCLPGIRAEFEARHEGVERDREIKLIVIGNGRVGKTSLCRRLIDNNFNTNEPSTHGVQFWNWDREVEQGPLHINVWDFGGQDIYYGTHAMFHRGRAVFLIAWEPEIERTPHYEDREHGLVHRNYPLQYWLDYVNHMSPRSPVIVVQTQCLSGRVGKDHLPQTGHLNQHNLNIRETFFCAEFEKNRENNRQQLTQYIEEAAEDALGTAEAQKLALSRWKVKRQLGDMIAAETPKTISMDEFNELCAAECLNKAHNREFLTFLHHCGTVFHNEAQFSQQIVLDQKWACRAIYSVFERRSSYRFICANGGRFTANDLADYCWDGQGKGEQALFLSMMESCEICFKLGKNENKEDVYLAPELAPKRDAVAKKILWSTDRETLWWRIEFPFLNPNLMRSAMCRLGEEYLDAATYWCDGLYIPDNATGAQILVEAEYGIAGDDNLGPGRITIQARGKGAWQILRKVCEAVYGHSRHRREEPLQRPKDALVWVSYDGHDFVNLDDLAKAKEAGNHNVLTSNRKVVAASEYEQYLSVEQQREKESSAEMEERMPPVKPKARSDSMVKPRKIPNWVLNGIDSMTTALSTAPPEMWADPRVVTVAFSVFAISAARSRNSSTDRCEVKELRESIEQKLNEALKETEKQKGRKLEYRQKITEEIIDLGVQIDLVSGRLVAIESWRDNFEQRLADLEKGGDDKGLSIAEKAREYTWHDLVKLVTRLNESQQKHLISRLELATEHLPGLKSTRAEMAGGIVDLMKQRGDRGVGQLFNAIAETCPDLVK